MRGIMYLGTAFQQSNFLQTPKRNVMFQRRLKSWKIYNILYLSKTYMRTYKDKWGSDQRHTCILIKINGEVMFSNYWSSILPPFVRETLISQTENCYISISYPKIFSWIFRPLPNEKADLFEEKFGLKFPKPLPNNSYICLCVSYNVDIEF